MVEELNQEQKRFPTWRLGRSALMNRKAYHGFIYASLGDYRTTHSTIRNPTMYVPLTARRMIYDQSYIDFMKRGGILAAAAVQIMQNFSAHFKRDSEMNVVRVR